MAFEGKVVLVTGSNGELGSAICAGFWGAGAVVVGTDRHVGPDDWQGVAADLAAPEQAETLIEQVERRFGPVEILVNNAAIYPALPWDGHDATTFDETMAVNLRAPFLLSAAFAKRRIAHGEAGSIVMVSSVAGRDPGLDPVYAVSKAGIIHLTKALGKSLGPSGIRVVGVAPGVIEGTMSERIPEPRRSAYRAGTPLQRFAQPEEIAAAVLWLAGPDASYVNGATLDINGGLA